MNKFLQNTIIFFGILAIINAYFFYIVYENYFVQYERIDKNYTTYLLSDSHGLPIAKYSEKYDFYNFSAASDSYVDMRRKLQYLIDNSKIQRLILTVDEHNLSQYRNYSNNIDRSNYFATVDDYNSIFDYITGQYIERYIPLINPKSRDIIKIYFQPRRTASGPTVLWNEFDANEKEAFTQQRIDKQFTNSGRSQLQLEALREIINICNQNNIELIGLKYPLTKEYLNGIKDSSFRADSILISKKIKVCDFSTLYENQDSLFANQDHLNERGGQLFTEVLFEKCVKE
ncbi:MAG: hypothetical protein CMC13_08130 [Flavobacteriaceae bacterium]|nr:hypothetical protein [Flavobacteriaceae bacterium]|tara:strand:- start:53181 stop:54041 length:861 start_codon:yes stop_codon:yes gene_type:complete